MNTNRIKLHRLLKLFRYEWRIDKRFYLLGITGVFLIAFGVFLSIWFNNIAGFVWRNVDYNSIFFAGFIFLSIFGVSLSFIDLRDKNNSIRYLTLPGSTIEKYIVQVCMKLVLPLILYPILFGLGANLSIDTFYFIQQSILSKTSLPEIEKANILYLYWFPNANIDLGYWALFGLIVLIPVLMFFGGILFGKWSFILMPLTVILIVLFFLGSYLGLSRIVDARIFGIGDNYAILLGSPEVMENVPLSILVSTIFVWLAVFITFLATYFKLKEREV